MSFSDLLSSSRGPGVIGLFMALLVLVGFGILAMLAFEEDGNGKSLAWVVRQNERRISNDTQRLADLNATLATAPALEATAGELVKITSRNTYLNTDFEVQTANLETAERRMTELEEKYYDYKNQYRAFVRENAEDTELEILQTITGEVYHDVNIRKVTAIGLEMRHRDGLKRIPFEALPIELQEYYQFDKNQKADEIKRELEMLKRHNKAVGIAQKHAYEADQRRKTEQAAEERQKILDLISEKEQRAYQLESEIAGINNTINSYAASSRSTGTIALDRSGIYRNRLASKQRELSSVRDEISKLRQKL